MHTLHTHLQAHTWPTVPHNDKAIFQSQQQQAVGKREASGFKLKVLLTFKGLIGVFKVEMGPNEKLISLCRLWRAAFAEEGQAIRGC